MSTELVEALKIYIVGFTEAEQRLLEATVKLSERRNPPLSLVSKEDCAQATVWMIDGNAPVDDKKWAVRMLRTLPSKVVIWVDAGKIPSDHSAMSRPIPWVNLPMVLVKAIQEQSSAAEDKVAAGLQQTGSFSMGTQPPLSRDVLIVDDSAPARTHLRGLLEDRGYRVTEAETAERGLYLAESGVRFACIMMDVVMPGIDGYEACRRIKANTQADYVPPVVMLTSRSSPFDRIRGSMAGANAYLVKPADAAELYEVLNRYATAGAQAGD